MFWLIERKKKKNEDEDKQRRWYLNHVNHVIFVNQCSDNYIILLHIMNNQQ